MSYPSLSTSCYTQYCLQHACIAICMIAAYQLAYPHNHKPRCRGVAIVQQPRLFANSSREQRRMDTKLSQITDATPGLDLRGATCTKKPLPRSTRRRNSKQTSAILDLWRKYTVFRAHSYAANTKEEPQPLFANSSCER